VTKRAVEEISKSLPVSPLLHNFHSYLSIVKFNQEPLLHLRNDRVVVMLFSSHFVTCCLRSLFFAIIKARNLLQISGSDYTRDGIAISYL
jgi:hypothetical protein